MILTVFDEDVGHVLPEAIRHDVLVGLHHVGAEDLLVAALRHVGPGRPGVGFQQFGAAGLRRKQSSQSPGIAELWCFTRHPLTIFATMK